MRRMYRGQTLQVRGIYIGQTLQERRMYGDGHYKKKDCTGNGHNMARHPMSINFFLEWNLFLKYTLEPTISP